jgi:hypothetical protein
LLTSSCKAKGRRLQDSVIEQLRNTFVDGMILVDDDIRPAIMGESGTDIKLSPSAKKIILFDIETKNTEKTQIWKFLKQTESNAEEGRIPLLVFSRNRSEEYCALKLKDLLKLFKPQNPSEN